MDKEIKNNRIIFIEGVRNVGKTFLLNQISDKHIIYKFPFAKYFNELHTHNIEELKQQLNSDPKLFFLTLGYDITLLDLASKGILKEDIFVDRGIISDIVFGIQSNRITKDFGLIVLNWIMENYGKCFDIIYIYTSDNIKDTRNKDEWDHYNKYETHRIYLNIMDSSELNPILFKNNFDNDSINKFKSCVSITHDGIIF